jgi:hypothetical protein
MVVTISDVRTPARSKAEKKGQNLPVEIMDFRMFHSLQPIFSHGLTVGFKKMGAQSVMLET